MKTFLLSSVECKQVPGFPRYFVTKCGRVFSRCAIGRTKKKVLDGERIREIVGGPHPFGYRLVGLKHEGKRTARLIHRLVLETFVGPRPDGMEARHLDGNPKNNALDNLAWGTPSQNQSDKKRHGTNPQGSRHPLSKLTESSVSEIKSLLRSGCLQKHIAERYGVSRSCIGIIAQGRRWSHVS